VVQPVQPVQPATLELQVMLETQVPMDLVVLVVHLETLVQQALQVTQEQQEALVKRVVLL
jgi:hypothetical protein